MRVLGIDPGYAIVGYGTVEYVNNKFYPVEFGAVTTQAHTPFEDRLKEVYDQLDVVIKRARPEAIAIEQLFFTTNQKTVIQVAMARGVILLCAKNNNIPVFVFIDFHVQFFPLKYFNDGFFLQTGFHLPIVPPLILSLTVLHRFST